MNFKTTLAKIDHAVECLKKYMKPDKEYIIEIKTAKDKRSLSQNEYYFAVVVTLFMNQTGFTKEESHQYLKDEFLYYEKEIVRTTGLKYNHGFTRSTTELDTREFEDYLEQCRLFIYHEFQIKCPLPNELTEEQLSNLEKLNKY